MQPVIIAGINGLLMVNAKFFDINPSEREDLNRKGFGIDAYGLRQFANSNSRKLDLAELETS